MRTLISNRDLRRVFEGVAGVAAAGLLAGMAMRPDLDAHEAQGPQVQAAGGGPRAYQAVADPGVSVYRGRIPDYVYGTDWTRPPVIELPPEAPAVDEYASEASTTVEAPPPASYATWREPPREPTVYPSVAGDTAYPSER